MTEKRETESTNPSKEKRGYRVPPPPPPREKPTEPEKPKE